VGASKVIRSAAINLNGISIAYVMGIVNSLLACLLAFGVHLTDQQIASLAALVNAGLILAVHIGHRVGEATASGAATAKSVAATSEAGGTGGGS
jgi:hypothetical protein